MKLAHSYSAIKMYENCPLRYYRQRILKDVKDEGNEANRYGERLHKLLEDRLGRAVTLPEEAAKYESLCASFERAAQRGGNLEVEFPLTLNEKLRKVDWFAKDAWLRARMDVFILQGDNAVVADWKTGARRPDFLQMQITAAMLFLMYPAVRKVSTAFVWLKVMEVDREVYQRSQLEALWADLMGRIERIKESVETNTWPARPSGLCDYCPARFTCEFARKR